MGLCATCQRDERDEREPITGYALIRCGCGVRRTPRIPASSLPVEAVQLRGTNGYMKGGVFYGECRAPGCGKPFEAAHQKQTCGAKACRQWSKSRTEKMIFRICGCGASYETREAHQSDYCGDKCRQRARRAAAKCSQPTVENR